MDAADTALHRLTREVRLALPNSVRVASSGTAVEFLRITTGGRYRRAGAGDVLDFSLSTDTFDVIGQLPQAGEVDASSSATEGACIAGTVDCLVVFNTGQTGADAYAGDNLAGVRAATSTSVSFSASAPFPYESSGQRFYIVDGPVSFVCDGDAVYRYSDYAISVSHDSVDTAAELEALGASRQLLADKVSGCEFAYDAGTATRSGLLRIALSHSQAGEDVRLLQQVQIRNVP